jgi:hypothetical protein
MFFEVLLVFVAIFRSMERELRAWVLAGETSISIPA